MGRKKGVEPSAVRVERKAALFEDRVVRCAFTELVGSLMRRDAHSMRRLMPRLAEIAEALPSDIAADEAAAMLQGFARERSSQKDTVLNRLRKAGLQVVAMLLDRMSAIDYESHDLCILWLRENATELDKRGRSRTKVIGWVASSALGPASCRMLRHSGNDLARLVRFDTCDAAIQDLVIETALFFGDRKARPIELSLGKVAGAFALSLGGCVPETPGGFGAEHLARQLEYFCYEENAAWLLVRIYLRIASLQGEGGRLAADGVTAAYLASPKFVNSFRDGYRAASFSPLDPPPEWDRWFLFPNGLEDDYAAGKPNKGLRVDFSGIEESLRGYAKKWVWEDTCSLKGRYDKLALLADYCAWHSGAADIAIPGQQYLICSDEIGQYLGLLRESRSKEYFKKTKSALRSLVDFLDEEDEGLVDLLCMSAIDGFGDGCGGKGKREKLTASPADCKRLEEAFKERAEDSIWDLLSYTAFLVLAHTPLRVSSILDLKLCHIVETARPGLYAVKQPSKTTGRDARGHQIPPEVKRALDRAVQATQELRDAAPEEMRSYVFLVPDSKSAATVLSKNALQKRIPSLSAKLKLPRYTPASIRGCYMTAANKAVGELGMGSEAERAASDHIDPDTGPLHYIRYEDREYYEALCGIEIGTAKIRGTLTPERPKGLGEADEVVNGCGWCACASCATAIANCLICSGFRTSPSQIPAFKDEITAVDLAIADLETDHDREHLAKYKSLVATYLCALEGMKHGMEGGAHDGGR